MDNNRNGQRKCQNCNTAFSSKLTQCPACGRAHEPPKAHEVGRFDGAWERRGTCGYKGCQHQALVKQWTITGWINLCPACIPLFHRDNPAQTIPKRITDNPVCKTIREARRK